MKGFDNRNRELDEEYIRLILIPRVSDNAALSIL